jgi:isoleucyl-tRNA synthetase
MAERTFPDVRSELDFPRDEQKILSFWQSERIFEKTLAAPKDKGTFVFYEGPPTANGVPHNGHVLTRAMKDLFPRYRTMRGFHVPRKAGWDTHGLPVEVEVEKELRIHGKAEIEAYGVEPFTERCIESVFRYTTDWERVTSRIGFWVDLADAYVTYHRSYVESEWWALSELFKKGLLYQGHKVVWWWAQGGTALSSAEVGWGYKTVDDPSAFVGFPLVDPLPGFEGALSLAVWTTTPWTLPSNMYAAVKADADYVPLRVGEQTYLVASALAADLAKKTKGQVIAGFTIKGSALLGRRYVPPFELYHGAHGEDRTAAGEAKYWRVLVEDFVTLDTGTGVVHVAPAFGEDDHRAFKRWEKAAGEPLDLFCAVRSDGGFVPEFAAYAGRWVKDTDKDILADLKRRGLLLFSEQYRHDYPFCWRSDDDALIQFARPAWYIRTTSKNAEALANNAGIDWHPEHIKEGRFGDFLRNNVDWALSRERFWGTPLPIWQNDALPEDHPERFVAISSLAELRGQTNSNLAEVEVEIAKVVTDPERAHHLLVHKPWIDRVTFTREGIEGTYRRVPEVIDCWFDSGCMPFAQWGFPHKEGSLEKLRESFPADFISEAIDQTRGWFYSLLMVSTLLFDEQKKAELGLKVGTSHPYKTCILLGHVCDKDGKKESKSKGNYTPPEVILDKVRMEFAVIDDAAILKADARGLKGSKALRPAEKGVAVIATEDLEGLDLADGAVVKLYPSTGTELRVTIRGLKGLPRRVVLLHADDIAALGVEVGAKGADVMPVEVPRLDARTRVHLEDPTMPAPGADAFRWFFYASSPPWTNTRHSLGNVRAQQKDFLVKLRNVYGFFTIYANIDGWKPGTAAPAPKDRPLLDRWVLSELAITTREVTAALDRYASYEAAQRLLGFVEALSNWYVRRSRERFWAPGAGADMSEDKRAAYATLHECLVTVARLIAPFVPFFAEEMYQGLVVQAGVPGAKESVHLESFPEADTSIIDDALCQETAAVRELVSLGLQVRADARLKVRQPLSRADIVLSRPDLLARVAPHQELLAEELNVKELRFFESAAGVEAVRYRLKPNFRVMGPKVGKRVQRVKQLLEKADAGQLRGELVTTGQVTIDVDGEPLVLTSEDLEISVEASEGFAASGGRVGVVAIHTALTPELLDEGLMREVQSKLQAMRKELKLGFTDRVLVAVDGSERLQRVVARYRDDLSQNVLIDRFPSDLAAFDAASSVREEATLDGEEARIFMTRA